MYPPADQVFNAFDLSACEATRVVILGQDPYHGPGQAHGPCFSVPDGLPKMPPSVVNNLKGTQSRCGSGDAEWQFGGVGETGRLAAQHDSHGA